MSVFKFKQSGRISLSIIMLILIAASCQKKVENKIKEPVMVLVKGETFTMGCFDGLGNDDEFPTHEVTLSDYFIAQNLVTQELWKSIMKSNPSVNIGENLPVENITFNQIMTFIEKLNNVSGKQYRLPTEAEWEYAARSGNESEEYQFSGSNNIDEVAWYEDNSNDQTHPIGTKKPNELEIYDMSGNLWEYCNDYYGNYPDSPQTNPSGPLTGISRIVRGGSFNLSSYYSRISIRGSATPDSKSKFRGFRLALSKSK